MNRESYSQIKAWIFDLLYQIASVDSQLVLLCVLLVFVVVVLDAVSARARKQSSAVGVSPHATTVSVDGSKSLPVRHYVSEIQGLAGRPDAVISEDGFIIPVERKPLARKIHDRYLSQNFVYMRLIEEFEGKKPPYGYLLLGPNCRRFKVENTSDRQAWLQKMIDEMRLIAEGAATKPAPHARKCARCDVREVCAFRADINSAGVDDPKNSR